jgi:hypothetical protein
MGNCSSQNVEAFWGNISGAGIFERHIRRVKRKREVGSSKF